MSGSHRTRSLFNNGIVAWEMKQYPIIEQQTGRLGVVELGKEFDFDVKRAFFLKDIKAGQTRGMHSHSQLKQLIICLRGSFSITLDIGQTKETLRMQDVNQCLYLDGRVWREMYSFSEDALILVLCDREYHDDEVIRDYSEFKRRLMEFSNV